MNWSTSPRCGTWFLVLGLLSMSSVILSSDRVAAGNSCSDVTDQSELRGVDPVPDSGGRIFPLVVIHGITGSAKEFNETIDESMTGAVLEPGRSMLDSLSGKAGQTAYPGLSHTRVYSFEYTADSLRWFTEAVDGKESVGVRFASVIDCLYALHGVPVMVLAHSMGGLVTRWAANQTLTPDGEPKIGKVVTLGTPYLGSSMSVAVANTTVDGLSAASPILRAIAWWCGRQGTSTGNSTAIDCDLLSSLKSQAGQALRLGSPELAELATWPDQAETTAIAGSILLERSLFGARVGDVEIGDVVVGLDSATSDRDREFVEQCQLFEDKSPSWVRTLKSMSIVGPIERLAKLIAMFWVVPCYHGKLMESVTIANEVFDEFNNWVADRQDQAQIAIPSGMEGDWSGKVKSPSGLVETRLTISVTDAMVSGNSGPRCKYTLKPELRSGDLLTLSAIEAPGCVQGGKWLLELLPNGTISYRWKDSYSAREDVGILSRGSSAASTTWPIDGGDVQGPPVLYVFLGSQLLLDDWVSCTDDKVICIVGVGQEVRVYRTSGIKQIASLALSSEVPASELSNLGLTGTQIAELLS